jgi:hypothetical protein
MKQAMMRGDDAMTQLNKDLDFEGRLKDSDLDSLSAQHTSSSMGYEYDD